MEVHDIPGIDAIYMYLVSSLMIPQKFKVPNFEKYTSLSCPRRHLAMFCQKIASYTHEDKLMIHCFHDSISEASLNWYIDLERIRIQLRRDLSNIFLKQLRRHGSRSHAVAKLISNEK